MAMQDERPKGEVPDLLTPFLRRREVWNTLAEAMEEVFSKNIEYPIEQLEHIRFLREGTDENILIESCRMLGFDLTQDVMNISVNRFTALVNQLPKYNDYNGRQEWINFFGFLLGSPASCQYLWTEDYAEFFPKAKGRLMVEGGSWYKTTHINLRIKRDNLEGVYLEQGQDLLDKVEELFHGQAPATLVLRRVTFYTQVGTEILIGAKVGRIKRFYRYGSFAHRVRTEIAAGAAVGRVKRKTIVKPEDYHDAQG